MFHLIPGSRGVEIRRHGFGPHPAVRVHGRVHHRDVGRLCWEAHRAQHPVEFSNRRVRAENFCFRLSAQAFDTL